MSDQPQANSSDHYAERMDHYTDASRDSEQTEVEYALRLLAATAREEDPRAAVLRLDDSDQGSWAVIDDVLDGDGNVIDDLRDALSDTGADSHLYDNRRYVASRYVAGDDEDQIDRRNPWRGVELSIDKILSTDFTPDPL